MEEVAFVNALVVVVVAFLAPLLLGLAPGLRLPAVVLEIVAGIVVGPSGLGWVQVDVALEVLSVLGLAFLLFLAGLEIDFARLRGPVLRVAALSFAVSLALALVCGLVLSAIGFGENAIFIAIVLSATSLGIVVPVLKDAGEAGTPFGQLVIATCSIADFAAIILLSIFFSREATSTGTRLILLAGFFAVCLLVALTAMGVEHSRRLRDVLVRLQDTTAQIRVRAAMVLLIAFAALAMGLGLEVILGTFAAGAILKLVDQDRMMTHPHLREKLEAMGFGLFIPVFFVTSGLRFDLDALFADAATLLHVPAFLAALLVARGLPALLFRRTVDDSRRVVAAGLLQATSLPFIVAATQIGQELDVIGAADTAAFIAAGLLSVLLLPAASLALLRGRRGPVAQPAPA